MSTAAPTPLSVPGRRTPLPRRVRRPVERPSGERSWRVSHHAGARATELGFTVGEVLAAATDPQLAYAQSRYGAAQALHIRGDVAVAVDRDRAVVITVLLRRDERWEHGQDRRAP